MGDLHIPELRKFVGFCKNFFSAGATPNRWRIHYGDTRKNVHRGPFFEERVKWATRRAKAGHMRAHERQIRKNKKYEKVLAAMKTQAPVSPPPTSGVAAIPAIPSIPSFPSFSSTQVFITSDYHEWECPGCGLTDRRPNFNSSNDVDPEVLKKALKETKDWLGE